MPTNELKGAIYARFKDAAEFARALGWSRQKVSYIVNGKQEPSLTDVQDMAKTLKMDVVEVASFFLAKESQKCDNE